jgi:DNA-binding beta-propeller fold protein YncE
MAILGVVAVLAVGGVLVYKFVLTGNSTTTSGTNNPGTTATAATTTQTPTTAASAPPATTSGQTTQSAAPAGLAVELPFTGLDRPVDVTVGVGGMSAGAVYVTDSGNNRVVRLAANSYTQTVPAFTSLNSPQGLAVDSDGDVYVTYGNDNRLLWARIPQSPPSPPWQASSSAEWVGPFSGLRAPHGAVMYPGSFFVADSGNNRVVKWTNGTNAAEVIPFSGLNNPNGVAMVNTGQHVVYVADTGNNRVVRQVAGSSNPQTVLPFTGLNNPHGVVVDDQGNVYVTDSGNNQVLKLAADRNNPTGLSTTQTILPFTGLNNPQGVAVDSQDNVYVVDSGNNRVLKLAKPLTVQ